MWATLVLLFVLIASVRHHRDADVYRVALLHSPLACTCETLKALHCHDRCCYTAAICVIDGAFDMYPDRLRPGSVVTCIK